MALTEEEKGERKRAGGRIYAEKHKERLREEHKQYYIKNKELMKSKSAAYYSTHRDEYRDYNKKYREDNKQKLTKIRETRKSADPVEFREISNVRAKQATLKMTDSYIRRLLVTYSDLKSSDIPQDWVLLKRQMLILTRTIREIQKCRQ